MSQEGRNLSDFLTIAVVTAAIRHIVQTAVQDAMPGVLVRIGPPLSVVPGEHEVSVYRYGLASNPDMRSRDMPVRSGDGASSAGHGIAVDLHYLIAFGGEDQLAIEIMLARVLIALAERPVLARQDIEAVVRPGGDFPALEGSDLAAQQEGIRLTPAYLTLEEQANLWNGCLQIAQRPSLQLKASPLLLSADARSQVSPGFQREATFSKGGAARTEQ